jgi:hypothetical protein
MGTNAISGPDMKAQSEAEARLGVHRENWKFVVSDSRKAKP